MSIVTLKTSITSDTDPWGGVLYGEPGAIRHAFPLTTAYAQPSGCNGFRDQTVGTCFMPYIANVWSYAGYFSPGVCFSGFTMGCFPDAPTVNYEPVKPSETVAICVPSGLTCVMSSSLGYQAASYATGGNTVTTELAFQIRWQSSDLSILEVAPTGVPDKSIKTQTTPRPQPTSGVTTAIVSSTATSNSPAETPTGSSQTLAGNESGLSGGVIAGIAVGVVLALLTLAAVAFLVVHRRRRSQKAAPGIPELDGHPRGDASGPQPAELATEDIEKVPKFPADGTSPTFPELGSEIPTYRVPELGGSVVTAPAELPLDFGNNGLPLPDPDQTHPAETSGSPLPRQNQHDFPREQAVDDLLTRQARLEERRQRLLQLEQIEQERDVIQHQLSVLQQQQQSQQPQQHQHQSPQRHEMP